jgi:DNA-binding transcriptional regulator LsrR (DeoR family)
MYVRMEHIGAAERFVFQLPITQRELGDAMGISTVHVNRSLQTLRAEGLVRVDQSEVEILDWPALQARGDFDPAYLHFDGEKGSKSA